jgi:hypothetical protein
LKRSLEEDISATLSPEELETLQVWVPLDSEGSEMRRLRAALLAESVRYLLAGRIEAATASSIADVVFEMLLSDSREGLRDYQGLRDYLLDSVR